MCSREKHAAARQLVCVKPEHQRRKQTGDERRLMFGKKYAEAFVNAQSRAWRQFPSVHIFHINIFCKNSFSYIALNMFSKIVSDKPG